MSVTAFEAVTYFDVTFLGIIIDILYSNYVVQRAIIMAKVLSSG